MQTLENKIKGYNLINQLSINQLKTILPQLTALIGQKILLASGGWGKKFIVNQLAIPRDNAAGSSYRCYFHTSGNSLWMFNDVTLKDSDLPGGGYSVSYYKRDIYIGSIDDTGVLTQIDNLDKIVNAWSLDKVFILQDVKDNIKRLEDLKSTARQLESDLRDFIRF